MSYIDALVEKLAGDPAYVKFLLMERPYIRSALLARPPLLNAEDRTMAYSTSVGNAMHNDIIELELWLETLSVQDQQLLLDWGANTDQKQVFGSRKMRRQSKNRRVIELVTDFGERQHAATPSL